MPVSSVYMEAVSRGLKVIAGYFVDNQRIDFEKIKQIANEFLKLEKPNKIMLEQLIEKIEFDKEKNIKIKLTFENPVN